jgi:hypothetical protein
MRSRVRSARLLVVACVAATAVVSSAGTGFAQVPAGDSVVGSDSGPRSSGREINAQSGPSGENPSGTVHVRFGFFTQFDAQVVCLSVSGNYAVVGYMGTYTQFNPVAQPPSSSGPISGILQIVDNGPKGSELGPDAVVEHDAFDSTTPPDCSAAGARPISGGLNGDYVVTDAPALPATKEQCKNGGWRSFPGFKNQGDCVSFVATNGKNPPSGP